VRIALISTPFLSVPPRAYGGTELIVHELARALPALGHQVVLFATGDSTHPPAGELRSLYGEPSWPPNTWSELQHVRFSLGSIAREGFDVVHDHCPTALAFAADFGAPLVYTIHHDFDPALNAYYQQCRGATYVAISQRQATRETGVRCEVVHHGLDPARYTGHSADRGHALFLGRMSSCKGPDLAISAARLAGCPIRLAGRPHEEDRDWYQKALRPLLAAPGVEWVGEADASMKRTLLGGARALLMPIRWEEPFGLVMIEAMLAGCPVIAFPRGATPEVIEEGVTGFFAQNVREMAGILRALDGFDREACRRRAASRWSATRMAEDYVAIYRRCVAGKGTSRLTETRPSQAGSTVGGWMLAQ
jgi:glycosyltransferase involved in cell wall biosynthesis